MIMKNLPQALHITHDPTILASDHKAPDHSAVVRHVGAQPLPHGLQLLRTRQHLLQAGDLGGEVAAGGQVLHAKVSAKGLDDVTRKVHVISLDSDNALGIHGQ